MKRNIEKLEKEIDDEQRNVAYDTREYTIEYIVDKYSKGVDEDKNEFFVPDYQREFVWDEKRQSRFIESLLVGFPIPYIFLAETKNGRYEIVDGSQRIRTLNAFLKDGLKIQQLEILKSLNGLYFRDLNMARQRKIKNTSLKMIVLSERTTDIDKTKNEIKNEIFERINRGSYLLKDMEKRKGIYRGKFNNFIYEMAKTKLYIELTPIAKWFQNRQEREELLLRYFAFLEWYPKFRDNMGIARQLDEYMDNKNKEFDKDEKMKNAMENDFKKMVMFVKKALPYGFSKQGIHQVSRVYFEAISVGVTLALRKNPSINPEKCGLQNVVKSNEFLAIISGKYHTHKPKRILERIDYIKNHLLRSN